MQRKSPTCETPGFSQKEGAPGHQEEQTCLQQLELTQLGELCHVRLLSLVTRSHSNTQI